MSVYADRIQDIHPAASGAHLSEVSTIPNGHSFPTGQQGSEYFRHQALNFKASRPLLPDVGLLALVPERWSVRWMSRHQVLTRLSEYFHVVWMNPASEWRELMHHRSDPKNQIIPESPGFTVYEPSIFSPRLYRPKWFAGQLTKWRLRQACALLKSRRCQRIILDIWRPEFADALSLIPFDTSSYHIVDEYSFSATDLPVSAEENRLISSVDHVFVSSVGLWEKKGCLNIHTTPIPNGTDYAAFSTPTAEPTDLSSIPHPRIGYAGYLKKTLDWALLSELARTHRDWSFVMAGAAIHDEIKPFLDEFSRYPNVYLLGAKTTSELAAYPQYFDVCVMPYLINDYTKYIYPLKLHDYLASGRPVVGTRIRSLENYGDLIELATSVDEWSLAIARALEPVSNLPEIRGERQSVARSHDWDFLVRRIALVLAEGLGPQYVDILRETLHSTAGMSRDWLNQHL